MGKLMSFSVNQAQDAVAWLIAKTKTPVWSEALGHPQMPDKATYRKPAKGLTAHLYHIVTTHPSLLEGGKVIVDVGPGVGSFMIIAQTFGNHVVGEEAPFIPDGCIEAYKGVTDLWGLDVTYGGFDRYLTLPFPYADETVDLFHFRGSFSAVMGFQTDTELPGAVRKLLRLMLKALRPGGQIWIGHTQDASLGRIHTTLADLKPLEHMGSWLVSMTTTRIHKV